MTENTAAPNRRNSTNRSSLEPAISSDLFRRTLLAASAMAAAVSLFTTGAGLQRYIPFLLAWSLAIAVQLGLFGLAWLIGIGRETRQLWIVALYSVTMVFSVTFSYVTLQSEFTEEIRPAEARRDLLDTVRGQIGETTQLVNQSIRESEELNLRLSSWLAMEQRNGWATKTCEEEDHCYLQRVCDRIRARINRWQQETGRPYREGPGEQLIYGILQTEVDSIGQLNQRLVAYREELDQGGGTLDENLTNRQRLSRLDQLLNRVPTVDLQAATCQAVAPPVPPDYGDHARDQSLGDEQPVYAFRDLMQLISGERPFSSEDYPTVFALALAVFIDLFVLIVALGASTLNRSDQQHTSFTKAPGAFEAQLQTDIAHWLDGALLHQENPSNDRQSFLASILETISFNHQGEAQLIPESQAQQRFGHLLVQSQAAQVESFVKYNRVGRLFLLQDWVYPALVRYLIEPKEAQPAH